MRAVLFSTLVMSFAPIAPIAQAAGDSQPAERPERTANDYAGVVPGRGMLQHEAIKRKVPPHPTVMWVGFRPNSDGSARVFLQLNAVPTYEQAVSGDTLVVHVDHVAMDSRNDQRPLDTHFFATPIASIVAKPDPNGVTVKVVFKHKENARQGIASVSQGEDGMQYLYLDFPQS